MGAHWSVDTAADGRRVVVQGELDLVAEQPLVDEVDALLAQPLGSSAGPLVVDLAGVDFIDSSGVRALVRMRRAHGDAVRFDRVSSTVRKVLDIAGLVDHLGIPARDASPGGSTGGSTAANGTGEPMSERRP